MARNPMRDGWRVLMRAPGVVLAEIVWRWTFGATLWVVLILSFREYFASVTISRAEYHLMKSLEPYTWLAITARVMHAFVMGARLLWPILVPAFVLMWILLATVGRVATVRSMSAPTERPNWVAVGELNAFRLLFGLAALLAFFGAGALVSATFDPQVHLGVDVLLMWVVIFVIGGIWSMVNWFCSTAQIFAARDGAGVRASLASMADLYRMRLGRIGTWFVLMRSGLVIVSTLLSLMMAGALLQGHRRAPIGGLVIITVAYFALSDLLYMWRLAAYIGMTEPEPSPPVMPQWQPTTAPVAAESSPNTMDGNLTTGADAES